MAKPKTKPTENNYKVSFVFSDKTFETQANSIMEGIESLANLNQDSPIKPREINSTCILRIEKNDRKIEELWNPLRLRRLMHNKILRELTQKRLGTVL